MSQKYNKSGCSDGAEVHDADADHYVHWCQCVVVLVGDIMLVISVGVSRFGAGV